MNYELIAKAIGWEVSPTAKTLKQRSTLPTEIPFGYFKVNIKDLPAIINDKGNKKLLAERLWESLGNIPINEKDELDEPFLDFPKGTGRFEIWSWFEEDFDVSVVELMGMK
jgi:hypothetical protein